MIANRLFKIGFLVLFVFFIIVYLFKDPIRSSILDYSIKNKRNFKHLNFKFQHKTLYLGNSLIASHDFNANQLNADKIGIGGETIEGISILLDSLKYSSHDTLVFWIGLNDVLNGKSFQKITADYQILFRNKFLENKIIKAILIPNICIKEEGFFVKNDLFNEKINAVNDYLKKLSVERNYKIVELKWLIESPCKMRQADGVHLSSEAYEFIVTNLRNA